MNLFVITTLLVVILVLIFIIVVQRREMKNISSEIRAINKEDSRRNIRLKAPSKSIGRLISDINNLIEEKNRSIEEYKIKDEELRDSIANMSHDLRTPLTSIMGYVYLLEDDNISEEDKKEYISIVKKRSGVLEKLIGDFYSLSRIQAEQYKVELKPMVISDSLGEIIAAFYDSLNDKFGEEAIIEIDESRETVLADKSLLNRIFTNVIENILKHGEGEVKIKLVNHLEYTRVEFSNKAKNLKKQDASRIFEKFFTGDRMRTGQNTGLGLAIVKLLVEKMNGEIYSEKKKDRLFINIKFNKK